MKYLFVLTLLIGLSCSSSKKVESPAVIRETVEADKPVINKAVYEILKFHTTSCFGRCPVYTVRYFSNGEMTYIGEDNVDYIGRYVKTLSKVQQADLNKLIEHAALDDSEENYDPYIVDASVTHLQYTVPGEKPYKTRGVMSWPDNIKKLIDHIKSEYKSPDKSWTKANLPKPLSRERKRN